MSHTLMSLDAEWRRLTRTSRARRALKQWSIAHPALRGLTDLDELLEQRRDDQAAPAVLRALAVLAAGDDLAARPCSGRCCPAWSAWPGSPATTTPPRSRRWCRWAGNASAPTRPGAGVRWRPTCCSKCASATRAYRRIDAPRSLDTEEIAAVAGLSLVGAIVALGLPGGPVTEASPPAQSSPSRPRQSSPSACPVARWQKPSPLARTWSGVAPIPPPRRERSVEALLTWRGLRPAIRRPRGDGSAGRPQATMGMACMAANRACPWACASPPASTSVRACW